MSSVAAKRLCQLTDEQVRKLNRQTIVFGHQSVGDNLMAGVRAVVKDDSRFQLNMKSAENGAGTDGPAFIDCHIGRNGNPESKNQAFAALMDSGIGRRGGIVLMKYCYIDIAPRTNIAQMAENYRKLFDEIRAKYPDLTVCHVTVPLTVADSDRSLTQKIRTFLRGILGRDANIQRNAFNRWLTRTYGGENLLFDLAKEESTRADGTRCMYRRGFTKVYTLAPEWTDDGGHLNAIAGRNIGEKFLGFLGNL